MKKFIFLILILFSGIAFSQVKESTPDITTENLAKFPEGIIALKNTFTSNFNSAKVQGKGKMKANIVFIVETDGSMNNIQVDSENESFTKEIISALKKISEKWIPAEKDGIKIRSRYRLPLTMDFN